MTHRSALLARQGLKVMADGAEQDSVLKVCKQPWYYSSTTAPAAQSRPP